MKPSPRRFADWAIARHPTPRMAAAIGGGTSIDDVHRLAGRDHILRFSAQSPGAKWTKERLWSSLAVWSASLAVGFRRAAFSPAVSRAAFESVIHLAAGPAIRAHFARADRHDGPPGVAALTEAEIVAMAGESDALPEFEGVPRVGWMIPMTAGGVVRPGLIQRATLSRAAESAGEEIIAPQAGEEGVILVKISRLIARINARLAELEAAE